MKFELGQKIIDSLRGKHLKTRIKTSYGKIWLPMYNLDVPISSQQPNIYNQEGRKMEAFFLRDIHWAHSPYHMQSKYFVWDRYNIGLKTHFYSHNTMLEQMGNPDRKYGIFFESESIARHDFDIFKKHKTLSDDFDLIFTFSESILDSVKNARFYPACCSSWFGTSLGGGTINPEAYLSKSKNFSILSSAKKENKYHKFRLALANKLKSLKLADTFGTFDGGKSVKIADTLSDYRFSFAIENDEKPYFFTERLTSCFASMTIPIYLGATKIDKFFNCDGIIKIGLNDLDNIENIIKKCTKDEYLSRLEAVKDNFERSKEYLNANDWLYKTYFLG